MQDLVERFRQNVTREMELQGISPSELARRMESSPQYVWNYMNQKRPGIDTLARFAEALDVDPANLLRAPTAAKLAKHSKPSSRGPQRVKV